MPTLSAIGVKLAILVLIAVAALGWHFFETNKAYGAGQLNERLVWQEQQRRVAIQQEAKLTTAQAKIDALEQQYSQRQVQNAVAVANLENTLNDERAENDKITSVCGPAFSRRLRDAIDATGR